MTASELHRKLLFCGYDELSDHLKGNPLNRYVYRKLLDVMAKHHIEGVRIVTIFNEVLYHCFRVQSDRKPGVDIQRRYIDEERVWLGSDDVTMLVFCIVWVFVKRKRVLSFQDECFLSQLTPTIRECKFVSFADDIDKYMESLSEYTVDRFFPKPCPIGDLIYNRVWDRKGFTLKRMFFIDNESDVNPWFIITDDYSCGAIEWYIMLYRNPYDQLNLYKLIYDSCPSKKREENMAFFSHLRNSIENGDYAPGGKYISSFYFDDLGSGESRAYPHDPTRMYKNDLDENDYKFNMAMIKAQEDELREEEENDGVEAADIPNLYEEECKTLRKQLDELTKSHELELSKMSAKYEVEIAELIKQLEQQPKVALVAEPQQEESESKELSLTVSEMVAHVKERFDERAAYQFCTMFYSLATKHGNLDEEASVLIDSVIPVIKQRDAHHQTINIPTAQQVNINPKEVVNHTKEE